MKETKVTRKENALAALDMYHHRLEFLKKEINYIISRTRRDRRKEAESIVKMQLIEEEVREIYKCLRVLESMLRRY
jgi:hypothetical protein